MRRTQHQIEDDRLALLFKLSDGAWKKTADVRPKRDRWQVYADLRALRRDGLVSSRRVKGDTRLFFCVECREVLTTENYGVCPRGNDHDLRPFYPKVAEWRLTADGVRYIRTRYRRAA